MSISSAYTIIQTLCLLKRAPIFFDKHSSIKSLIKTLNKQGEIIPPCLTPQVIWNFPDFFLLLKKIIPHEES